MSESTPPPAAEEPIPADSEIHQAADIVAAVFNRLQERPRQPDATPTLSASESLATAARRSKLPRRALRFIEEQSQDWTTPVIEQVREWLRGEHTTVAILGQNGLGKTVAATRVALDYLARGNRKVRFLNASTLLELLEEARTIGDSGEAEFRSVARAIQEFVGYDLLIIDELQAARATEAASRHIHNIVSTRHEDLKPTILLTNHTEAGLAESVGNAVADRIKQSCLDLAGESYR
jgi:DNA replication protein DnaC